MRFSFLLLILLAASSLRADALASRLRLLLPGEEAATVNERQFLYQRISTLFRELEDQKIGRKSAKKQIGKIQDHLERKYLRSYFEDAELADAFRLARYNDATAAVLNALALEHFGVDYYAVVDHWEAYLLADPQGKSVIIKHPDSRKRKEGDEAAFKASFVELVRATVAEDLSVRNQDEIEVAFKQYYYEPKKILSFGQLSAYALFRRAQAAYGAKNYEEAIALSRKASGRENRSAFLVLLKAAELQQVAIARPDQTGDIGEFYQQWTDNPGNQYLPAAILNHFDEQQQLLLAQDRPDLARKLLDDYAAKAPAGSAKWEQELIQLQRLRLLNHFFSQGRLDLAKAEAEALHADNPADETFRYVLGEIIIGNLRRTAARGESFQREVQAAADRYPFVRSQDRFADLLLRELAWKVRDLYAVDREAEASTALNKFRTALVDIPIGRERSLWTLTAFYSASDFYFRQKNFNRARSFVEEALGYSPDDHFLLHQQDLLSRY